MGEGKVSVKVTDQWFAFSLCFFYLHLDSYYYIDRFLSYFVILSWIYSLFKLPPFLLIFCLYCWFWFFTLCHAISSSTDNVLFFTPQPTSEAETCQRTSQISVQLKSSESVFMRGSEVLWQPVQDQMGYRPCISINRHISWKSYHVCLCEMNFLPVLL